MMKRKSSRFHQFNDIPSKMNINSRSFLEMEVAVDERLVQVNDEGSNSEKNNQNDRLGFGDLKIEEGNDICEVVRRRGRKKSKRKCWEKAIQLAKDMTISRSCRYRLSVPVMFWTTVFLILLARGVSSVGYENSRFSRSPKYEQEADVQGGPITPSLQDTYNVMQFLRELIQRQQYRANQQHQQQQLQVYNNGEDLSDNPIDWRKIPSIPKLSLLNQIRSIINDGSKEEDKRGSYMSLCHFKICNLG